MRLSNTTTTADHLRIDTWPDGLLRSLSDKESSCQWRRHGFNPWVGKILGGGATDSSILAGNIPRTEEPGRLQFTGVEKSETQLSEHTYTWPDLGRSPRTLKLEEKSRDLESLELSWWMAVCWRQRTPDAPAQIPAVALIQLFLWRFTSFPGGSVVKNTPATVGDIRDISSIPGLGRSPGGGHDNSLLYSFLENPMDRRAWWVAVQRVAKSQTWLNRLHTDFLQDCFHCLPSLPTQRPWSTHSSVILLPFKFNEHCC